jgi:hypothetical protein
MWQILIAAGISVLMLFAGCAAWRASEDRQREQRIEAHRGGVIYTMARARPIVRAIDAYTRQNGKPPARLEALQPRHLKFVPSPGPMARNRIWFYEVGKRREAGDWALGVDVAREYTPQGWTSFGDVFVYHPSGRYRREDYGGVLERIRDWGYYHE